MTRLNTALPVVVWAVFCICDAMVTPASAGTAELYRRGHVELEELFVIGGEDAPEEEVAFRVSNFDFDTGGNILFPDGKLHTIFKFSDSGEFMGTMCSEGGGPGDLRRPGSLAVEPTGNIVIFDFGNRRVQRLNPVGEYVASTNCYDLLSGLTVGPSGEIYAMAYRVPEGPPRSESDYRIIRLEDDLTESAVIEEASIVTSVVAEIPDGYSMTIAPYPASLELAPLPGNRIVVGRSDENELRVRSPSGEIVETITLEGDPPPVTDRDREKYFAKFISDGKDVLNPRVREKIEFPKHKPYFGRITVDDEYNILVRWGDPTGGDAVFLAYTHEGELISRVTMDELPADVKIRGDRLYALDRSYDVLPTITCYRMK
jgi:hypothetical protein